jgi:trans-aconitate methyltransferase
MTQREIKQTEAYYNKNSHFWTDRKTNSFYHESQFKKLVKLWPEKGAIIDIGCAHGIHVPLFLGIGRKLKYYGVDISATFLKIATSRYPQLTFAKANIADKTSLPKKKFDGFMAAAVLMHVPHQQWDEMFENLESLSKPGSYGYVTLPVSHPNGDREVQHDTRHFTLLTDAEQKAYLKQRGWNIKASGISDGFTQEAIWRWYIVELPRKK